jgi:hypothetical protein
VLSPTAQPLVRFVHLLGADGRPVAQFDSVPCAGACPAPTWRAGEVLKDEVTLLVPAGAPPGPYLLAVGWYDGGTLQRLGAADADGQLAADGLAPLGSLAVNP